MGFMSGSLKLWLQRELARNLHPHSSSGGQSLRTSPHPCPQAGPLPSSVPSTPWYYNSFLHPVPSLYMGVSLK
ncbi:rCG33552 [Rattus norvegicus]|uniref:RCG33552 n=1 Tax=Rattus norvegicus TaxID=10116 RepID=A6HI83_RAT|nr:rCG33552 [Rattus norvegicus]